MKDCDEFFISSVTGRSHKVTGHALSCQSSNIIYLATCTRCGAQYVGETKKPLQHRMNNARYEHKHSREDMSVKTSCPLVSEHFWWKNSACSEALDEDHIKHFRVQPIHQLISIPGTDEAVLLRERLEMENHYIKLLRTLYPYGLNMSLNKFKGEKLISERSVESLFIPIPTSKRAKGGQGKSKASKSKGHTTPLLLWLTMRFATMTIFRHLRSI
jgi:hypothetical protein